jgi:hypothetical protein
MAPLVGSSSTIRYASKPPKCSFNGQPRRQAFTDWRMSRRCGHDIDEDHPALANELEAVGERGGSYSGPDTAAGHHRSTRSIQQRRMPRAALGLPCSPGPANRHGWGASAGSAGGKFHGGLACGIERVNGPAARSKVCSAADFGGSVPGPLPSDGRQPDHRLPAPRRR